MATDFAATPVSSPPRKALKNLPVILARLIIGAVFIFSGFVKAIDPWGSVYKFTEYFNILGFGEYSALVTFSVVIVVLFEFSLGVMIFTGIYRRLSALFATLFISAMLALTLYIAVTDSVTDCGCFGDAVHMSNWTTFAKNVFLTAGCVYLLFKNSTLVNYYGEAVQWLIVISSLLYIGYIMFIGYYYQPMLDFRPYKVGAAIVADDGEEVAEPLFEYTDGSVSQLFTAESLPADDSGWKFVARRDENSSQIPSNSSLAIMEDGVDLAPSLLLDGEVLLLLFPDLDEVEVSYTFAINELYNFAKNNDLQFIALASGNEAALSRWRDLSMASYPIYTIDDSILKQIARGNPAIVYLKDGIVQWKNSLQAVPLDKFEQSVESLEELNDFSPDSRELWNVTYIYIGLLIFLLILNRTHKLPVINGFLEKQYANFMNYLKKN